MYGLWLFKELKTEYGNCKVELYRMGYTASAIEIGALVGNSLNLALENLDTITAPIGKSVCSFEIYDTEQFEYDDLFTPDATAYKVVVSTKVDGGEYNTRWSGYITPDFFAENLSYRTPISISARDNIGYLNDVDFDLDTATITVRELIQAAFRKIAEDYPMSLSFVTQKQTEEGILAIDATISTALLREKTWYEALEMLLHDLGLQMRWVDNNTIAVLDISQLGENFGLQRFKFIESSGYREILPAWRELSQKQEYGLRENFFEGRLKSNSLTFVKEIVFRPPNATDWTTSLACYVPNNYGVARDAFTTDPEYYGSKFGNKIYFSSVSEEYPYTTYLSWRQSVQASNKPMKFSFKAFNSVVFPGEKYANSTAPSGRKLTAYNPIGSGIVFSEQQGDFLQIGIKVNLLLHSGLETYMLRTNWVKVENGEDVKSSLNFILPKVEVSYVNGNDVQGTEPLEQDVNIDIATIPFAGDLELRIYGYYIVGKHNYWEDDWSLNDYKFDWDKCLTYINDPVYSFNTEDADSGQDAKVVIAELHNVKQSEDYKFGQVPANAGGTNAYVGALVDNKGKELVGFKRNVDSTTYPLLELVGREIIHFNKRNYNKLSGTIKNLAKEPLRFDKVFIYKGKNYLPFAYSLDVISNTMNITTMQEVEPYTTHSFVEIKSELVTGGGATISGGNNTALQYSAEVGNAKRISELNNASESEKKESYIVIDNASWNESKKVPLSEMEGLDEAQVEAYLTENKYAKQSWVKDITDDLETDIANRVLIEDFDKLQEAVDLNYANLNKAITRISTLEGYFSNGVANNAAKLGGQLPSYYATKSALDTTNTNLSNLSTTVGTIAGNLSSLTGRVSTAEDTIKGHTSSISKAVADIAANAKNISTNSAAITTLNSKVAKLESYWYIDNNGNLHTTYNIVSDKDVVAGGEYSGGSGGGGSTGLGAVTIKTVSGQEYKTNANGVVTIPDYQPKGNYLTAVPSGYATESWVEDNYQPKGNYLTGITSAMVTTALGYVPFNSTSFTTATIKSALGIKDWALAASKPSYSWSEITGKPTFATVATSGKYSDLSGVPTTLPASDVYAWAKKSSLALADVPDLSSKYAAVGLVGTSRYLAIPNGGYIFTKGGFDWNVTNGDWSASYKMLHEGNYADTTDKRYLSITGGEIYSESYSPLRLKTTNTQNRLEFVINNTTKALVGYHPTYGAWLYNPNGNGYIGIKDDGTPHYNSNTLIHSGNISSQNVNSARKLYYIGAVPSSGFDANTALPGGGRMSNYTSGGWWGSTMPAMSYGTIYQLQGDDTNNDLAGQLAWDVNHRGADSTRNLWWRANDDTNFSNAKWHKIAFTDSNVASATKLQTARTIWGQSFDGAADVWGGIDVDGYKDTNSITKVADLGTRGLVINAVSIRTNWGMCFWTEGNGRGMIQQQAFTSAATTYPICLQPFGGNVLIGTTTDNGGKLQVNGDFKATGDGIYGSDARYKSKLQDLSVDVKTIANAPVFSYKWTDREDDKVHLGTTAQYWLDTNFKDAVDTSNKDFYHLNYGALGVAIGVTVAKKVVNHEERILALERENETLKSELNQLRQWRN